MSKLLKPNAVIRNLTCLSKHDCGALFNSVALVSRPQENTHVSCSRNHSPACCGWAVPYNYLLSTQTHVPRVLVHGASIRIVACRQNTRGMHRLLHYEIQSLYWLDYWINITMTVIARITEVDIL